MKWLSGAGEEAAVETGAQGCCAPGKLTPKKQAAALHAISEVQVHLKLSLIHQCNARIKHGSKTAQGHCDIQERNVQEYSYRVRALSHLMKDAADHSTSLPI